MEAMIGTPRRGIGTVEVAERYTLAQTLADGTIIRSDGQGLWRLSRHGKSGASWRGAPPAGWDPAQAVEDHYACHYEMDVDYS